MAAGFAAFAANDDKESVTRRHSLFVTRRLDRRVQRKAGQRQTLEPSPAGWIRRFRGE
ncbi:MAG: hypothetical protein KatS3mg119_1600 [Rhodothalassiaceae bacterium]|nr:MAG: hypothetical protein KatS3mg119_1600 [Rhodothalassiaceae bacterium]